MVDKESLRLAEVASRLEELSNAEVGAGGRALPKHLVRSMSEVSRYLTYPSIYSQEHE